MQALKAHDFPALGKAIEAEHAIIDRQQDLIGKRRKK